MLAQMQDREDRDEAVTGSAAPSLGASASAQLPGAQGAAETAQVPAWMRKLQEQARSWRQALPKVRAARTHRALAPSLAHPPSLLILCGRRSRLAVPLPDAQALAPAAQDAASVLNPLYRWLAREAKLAATLLVQVHAQLVAVDAVCSGAAKATNTQRDLMSALSKGAPLPSARCQARNTYAYAAARFIHPRLSPFRFLAGVVPADWKRFFHVADVTVGVWLVDFGKRVMQLQDLCACGVQQLGRRGVWLGGLFSPEAFVTATRQAVAQQLRCGLESLRMVVTIGEQGVGDATFIIKGACAWQRRCSHHFVGVLLAAYSHVLTHSCFSPLKRCPTVLAQTSFWKAPSGIVARSACARTCALCCRSRASTGCTWVQSTRASRITRWRCRCI